jgi:hypothetical protein
MDSETEGYESDEYDYDTDEEEGLDYWNVTLLLIPLLLRALGRACNLFQI